MKRSDFLKLIAATSIMGTLSGFKKYTDSLEKQDEKMPVLFVGHGSPMNAIEDNEFSRRWQQTGKELPLPPPCSLFWHIGLPGARTLRR